MESLTTYCQAGYLVSGRLSAAVRLAPNNRIHAPKSFHIDAPSNRIHVPNRSIDMQPKSAYMHPEVSAYMHPVSGFFSNLKKL